MTDEELKNRFIEYMNDLVDVSSFDDPTELAKSCFLLNKNTHNNWNILAQEYKELMVMFAKEAIKRNKNE